MVSTVVSLEERNVITKTTEPAVVPVLFWTLPLQNQMLNQLPLDQNADFRIAAKDCPLSSRLPVFLTFSYVLTDLIIYLMEVNGIGYVLKSWLILMPLHFSSTLISCHTPFGASILAMNRHKTPWDGNFDFARWFIITSELILYINKQ